MDVQTATAQAAAAASAEVAGHLERLAVHGVSFDVIVAAATSAAVNVLEAIHASECAAAAAIVAQDHAAALEQLELERDAALSALPPLRASVAETAEALEEVRGERDAARRDAGRFRAALDTIARIPYEGPEPPARRVARENLEP